jgi:hypothetical protein
MSSSVAQAHWFKVASDLVGRRRNVGDTSDTDTQRSNSSRSHNGPASAGSSKICSEPTCMGCSRDSGSMNMASLTGISATPTAPFCSSPFGLRA